MANLLSMKPQLIRILFYLAIVISSANAKCYSSIFSFGDSLADTGIICALKKENPPHNCRSPYGQTYFHRPTGRYSDGRLVIDFIAQYVGLPRIAPYVRGSSEKFLNGANFAAGGATAMDDDFFDRKGIKMTTRNISLGVQLGWFKELLPSLCSSSSDCKKLLGNSLILMGEIGGNDVNFPFFQNKNINEIQRFVPHIITAIGSAITELIELGGVSFLVPGNLPIGCSASYLTLYQTENRDEYDPITGCLTWLNKFVENYNKMLQVELTRIRNLYPKTNVMYADYYNVAMRIYEKPKDYGFVREPTKACCGGGGRYNYNPLKPCGNVSFSDDPSSCFSWDGIHLTEAAYRSISKGIIEDQYTIPRFNASCVSPFGGCDSSLDVKKLISLG